MSFKITRDDSRVDWLDAFANKINEISQQPRTAVEVARNREQQTILDQIHAIVSGNPYASYNVGGRSVEGVVREMQERTGLSEYLKRVANDPAVSSGSKEELPESFAKLDAALKDKINYFITNLIETHHGNIHVPAVAESVLTTFQNQGINTQQINDPLFEKFISDCIVKVKKSDVGKSNDADVMNIGRGVGVESGDEGKEDDAFGHLMPAGK